MQKRHQSWHLLLMALQPNCAPQKLNACHWHLGFVLIFVASAFYAGKTFLGVALRSGCR
jgi:hypothetical protein